METTREIIKKNWEKYQQPFIFATFVVVAVVIFITGVSLPENTPQKTQQPKVVQPTKNEGAIVESNKLEKAYALAHQKSYDKLTESLGYMKNANESMRVSVYAYVSEDNDALAVGMYLLITSLEKARESVQESKRLIINVQVPDNIRDLHSKWIALIDEFKEFPDKYADIMPKVVDGKAGAVEAAEALAIEMQELIKRAIDISQKIVNTL